MAAKKSSDVAGLSSANLRFTEESESGKVPSCREPRVPMMPRLFLISVERFHQRATNFWETKVLD